MKKIKNFRNYSITEDGRVFTHNMRNGWLSPGTDKNGYIRYHLTNDDGKRVGIYAHQLVARAFLDNPENKPFVNHKDHDKSNNNASNLEWCTHIENIRHDWDSGTRKVRYGKDVGTAKINESVVAKIRSMYSGGASQVQLAEFFGISQPTISQITLRKTWRNV